MNELTVERAFEIRNQFIEVHSKSKLVELKLIWEMWQGNCHKKLGFETWEMFCEAPFESGGIGISRSYASQLIQVYEKFIQQLGLSEEKVLQIGARKLYNFKDKVSEENLDDFVARAETLSSRDLRLEMDNINPDECQHDYIIIKKCRTCGRWEK